MCTGTASGPVKRVRRASSSASINWVGVGVLVAVVEPWFSAALLWFVVCSCSFLRGFYGVVKRFNESCFAKLLDFSFRFE